MRLSSSAKADRTRPVWGASLRRLAVGLAVLYLAVLWIATSAWARQEFETRTMYKGTHSRATFDRDVARVAVGDSGILSTETLSDRELLFLGREVGRTSVIIWFQDGTIEEFNLLVERDLSLLERLLADIHSGITAEVAPDRDAVVLRGLVPDVTYSIAAESAARSYLEAGSKSRGNETPLVQGGEDAGTTGAPVRVTGSGNERTSQSVINLIQLEVLPATLDEKLRAALDDLDATEVTVQRSIRGVVPDDEEDIFVLRGTVKDQVTLTRALTLVNNLVRPEAQGSAQVIEVIADESGALIGQGTSTNSSVSTPSSSGSGSSGSALSGASLINQIESNIGRAKALSIADGRVLSYIEVDDIPQVRVDIRLYEVDRNKLFNFTPNTVIAGSDFNQPSLNPPAGAVLIEGEDNAIRTGSQSEVDIQGVVTALAGGLGTEFQVAGKHVAIDTAFDLLESRGIARTLSRPSLAVLSGEVAVFSVGGEVPISQQVFTDVTGTGGSSVLQETQFRSFGIELGVRPLVGPDSQVTMDVVPSISLPDSTLTASIRASTGSDLDTTAFETRYLRTSARLRDGQALILGGLHSVTQAENTEYTPWFSQIPLVGWMFKTRRTQDQHMDLVIIVHPVIVRDPIPEAMLWEYPDARDLLEAARASD